MLSYNDLYESLDSALWSLGATTHDLVVSTMESRGVLFRPSQVDTKAVDRILIELFGVGSFSIIVLANQRLRSKMLIGFDDSRINDPVEKIQRWLKVSSNPKQAVV